MNEFVYHAGTGTVLDLAHSSIVEVPADVEDPEEYCETPRPVRPRRMMLPIAEIEQGPIRSLYLVRGLDHEGENQDLFVTAIDPGEAARIWNDYCIAEEWPRNASDDEHEEPSNIRLVLEDVGGTIYDGQSRAVEWHELKLVA